MLTARERAELMADRIQWSGRISPCGTEVTFPRLHRRTLYETHMWLYDGGIPRRDRRPLVDFLEECLDAHERERDPLTPRKALLPKRSTVTTEPGSVAAALECKYGYVELFRNVPFWPLPPLPGPDTSYIAPVCEPDAE